MVTVLLESSHMHCGDFFIRVFQMDCLSEGVVLCVSFVHRGLEIYVQVGYI